MAQNVQMIVTGQFENAEKSREAINLAARYFKKRGLTLLQVSDMPGVSAKDFEEAKRIAQANQNRDDQSDDQSVGTGDQVSN